MTKESIYSTDIEPLLVTPFPSFILLPSGKIAKGNLAHFDYSTVDTEELKNQPIQDTLFSVLGNDVIESILTSTVALRLHDIPITKKNHSLISTTLYTKPTTFDNEAAVYVLCVPNNEVRSLDEEQQHLIDLKNGIHESFMTVTLDQDGFIIQTNQQFLKTSHWTPKRVIGKTIWQLFPKSEESEKVSHSIWKTLQNGQVWQGEVQHPRDCI